MFKKKINIPHLDATILCHPFHFLLMEINYIVRHRKAYPATGGILSTPFQRGGGRRRQVGDNALLEQ